MIDWKINLSGDSGEIATMQTEGDLAAVCADISFGISCLYNRLLKADTKLAKRFRNALVLGLIDPDNPVWKKLEVPDETVVDTSVLRRLAEQKRTPDHEEDS